MTLKKRRLLYFLLFILIIPIGLSTRKEPQWYFSLIANYGGNVFWSTMFFFIFRFLWSAGAVWIDKIRATFLGSMLLGNTFLWSDILCYMVGTVLGWLISLIADSYTQS